MLLDRILERLIDQGVVNGATGWTGYISFSPNDDNAVVITETTPRQDSDQAVGAPHDYPSFQAKIRGTRTGYQLTRAKADQVYEALNQFGVEGEIVYAYARHQPIQMGYDANERTVLVINFDCMTTRTEA